MTIGEDYRFLRNIFLSVCSEKRICPIVCEKCTYDADYKTLQAFGPDNTYFMDLLDTIEVIK